ncbi:MAG: VOC family protein [Streptococcaceae bacterium]|nr:VOC family protein [Streptococcaceae bacterium]MCL2681376.1 VOC family protein [Streptococcaceae bacterium]MCL2858581.1 VOC family protein [Streptococcaceae bacterium]
MSKITPFLTFNGQAKEAMKHYTKVLPDTKTLLTVSYGETGAFDHLDDEDKTRIMQGSISILGQNFILLDMDKAHPAPEFSWASSFLIDCQTEEEFDLLFNAFSKEGEVLMGPDSMGPIRKCAWVTDKFGITWQPVWK